LEHRAPHPADEDVSFPRGEPLARVERQARGSNRRNPEDERWFHAGRRMLGCRWTRRVARRVAVVRASVGDDRPAVILAGFDDVDFVATHGAVLVFPELAGLRMNREAEDVANAKRIYLRPVA